MLRQFILIGGPADGDEKVAKVRRAPKHITFRNEGVIHVYKLTDETSVYSEEDSNITKSIKSSYKYHGWVTKDTATIPAKE